MSRGDTRNEQFKDSVHESREKEWGLIRGKESGHNFSGAWSKSRTSIKKIDVELAVL